MGTCVHAPTKSTSAALWAASGCKMGGGDLGIMKSARIGCMSANGGFPVASCSADTSVLSLSLYMMQRRLSS